MPDFILVDKDKANFIPAFGKAMVVVKPGELKASGKTKLKDKKVCIDGDEKDVEVPGCMYVAPPYVIPGTGTLKIDSITGKHKAKETKSGGKLVLLKGAMFKAKFEVQNPAKQPQPSAPPVPDSTSSYSGKGSFITTNTHFKGT